MTCACESVHKFPCQFPGETEFFVCDGRQWCRFHLPLQDAGGNLSDKGRGKDGWEPKGGRRKIFTEEVHARLKGKTAVDGFIVDPAVGAGTDLRGVAFPALFSFTGITDTLHVNFEGATFGDRAYFRGATFGIMANFTGTTFGIMADFTGATFGDWTNFTGATFGAWAYFTDATFSGRAYFRDAIFGHSAVFTGATFRIIADFTDATFGGGAVFNSVNFQDSADFSVANSTDAKAKLQQVDFSNGIFTGSCKFDNRIFGTDVNFNGAVFHDLAAFHGCEFHPGMSFHQTKFLKTKGKDDDATERLERSYRTLKLEMEKLRARNEEADFFALEMECRRQRGSVPRFERFAATLYKHLSDYGRSVDLPLIWLLVLAYAAHYLYLGVAMIGCNPGPGARLALTLEQMFRPFFVWAKSAPGTGNCLVENSPLLIPFLASLQSLGTIGLLTLFLLALRRRFKMD